MFGCGSTGTLYEAEMGWGEGSKKDEITKGRGETILLVDDEENIRTINQEILTRFGYTVFTARSGEEALTIYKRNESKIDLVLLDLSMPGMGGVKCLEILLQMDPRTKVIIASGDPAGKNAKEALKAGASGFLAKPYHYSEILNRVSEILNSHKPW